MKISCVAVRVAFLCGVCIVSQVLPVSWAAESSRGQFTEPVGELSLRQALDAALKRHPSLAVSAFELRAANARIEQAGLTLNPSVSLQLENVAGSGAFRGVDAMETTLALSQAIELGGKRSYRVNVATIDRELSGVDRQAQQLDVLADVTRRFIDVALAQRQLVLAERATELTRQTLDAITSRVQSARSPQAEQSRAGIALTRSRIEQQQAQNNLQSARRALAALWSGRSPSFTVATADLFTLPSVASFDVLEKRLQSNPDFLRFASEARLRDAELRLARAQARPDVTVSFGVRRFESTNDAALVLGVSTALPVFNRNQGAIREAQERSEQLRVQSQAALLSAEATLYRLYQDLASARMRVTTLQGEGIPQAEATLTQVQSGYERGRFSYLELASAQQELLGLEGAAIEAAAEYHRLLSELERLTGEPLTDDNLEAPLP